MDMVPADKIEKGEVKRRKGHKLIGVLLSMTGFLWLARKAGWMPHDTGWAPHHATDSIFLPLVLIISGLLLIFGLVGRVRKRS